VRKGAFVRSRPGTRGAATGLEIVPAAADLYPAARAIVAAAPILHVHIGARLRQGGAGRGTPELWALLDGEVPAAFVQRGRGVAWAIDVPRKGDERVTTALGHFVASSPMSHEILFGPEDEVARILDAARKYGRKLVEIRRQQMMATTGPPAPDKPVAVRGFAMRASLRPDLPWLLDTHAAMCREDLGVDQVGRNRSAYESYFSGLIKRGRSYVIEVQGRRVGKAEVPLTSDHAWLVEGVFTVPELRGQGLATRMMAELVAAAWADHRATCLYVHRRNKRAVAVYERVGFQTISPWTTAVAGPDDGRPERPAEW